MTLAPLPGVSFDSYNYTDTDHPLDRFHTWPDDDALDPRADWDDVSLIAYNACGYREELDTGGIEGCFNRVRDGYPKNDDRALDTARRYARIFLGWNEPDTLNGIRIDTVRGYSQSDWWNVLTIDHSPNHDAEPYLQEWADYARGEVYVVQQARFTPCNDPACMEDMLDGAHANDQSHWDNIETIGGIYADTAENATAHFIADYAAPTD